MPFSKFLEIIHLEKTDCELTDAINLIAILADKDVKEIGNIPKFKFEPLVANADFLLETPDTSTSTVFWPLKTLDTLTMDNFIEFETMKKDYNHYPALLSMMSGIKVDVILKMSTIDVLNGFFLLQKVSTKYIQHSARSLLWRVTKQRLKDKFRFWQKK